MTPGIFPSGHIMTVQEPLAIQRAIIERSDGTKPSKIARTAFVEIIADDNSVKVFACDQQGKSASFVEFSFAGGFFVVTHNDTTSPRIPEHFEPFTFEKIII